MVPYLKYFNSKFQVLQSTSHVQSSSHPKPKISPSPSLRILKTAAPSLGKVNKLHRHLEPSSAVSEETVLPVEALYTSQNSVKLTRKPVTSSAFKPRFKNIRQKEQEIATVTVNEQENNEQDVAQHSNYKKSQRSRAQNNRNPK